MEPSHDVGDAPPYGPGVAYDVVFWYAMHALYELDHRVSIHKHPVPREGPLALPHTPVVEEEDIHTSRDIHADRLMSRRGFKQLHVGVEIDGGGASFLGIEALIGIDYTREEGSV